MVNDLPRYNFLVEPLIRVRCQNGEVRGVSLPEIYVLVEQNAVVSFPALRPHQEPVWHAFLVQLGAIALISAGQTCMEDMDVETWRGCLRALTKEWEDDAPWSLCAPDGKPGLLQPVGLEESREVEPLVSPDLLDVLLTSKNHDVKQGRMNRAAPDDWLFALVSVQSQAGYDGRGHVGIARMNGGYGSRVMVRVSSTQGWGSRVTRDIRRVVGDPELNFATGARSLLLWLMPWDGRTQLPLKDLHPLTIEVARRIRCWIVDEGRVAARHSTSERQRVAAKEALGNVGDLWTPIEQTDPPKALSLTNEGYSYRVISRLLFGDPKRSYHLPLLSRVGESETGTVHLSFSGLARGQGKTEGFHARTIILPGKAAGMLRQKRDVIAKRARDQVQLVAAVSGKALRPALVVMFQKAPEKVAWDKPSNDTLVRPWLDRFDHAADSEFFGYLSRWAEATAEGVDDGTAELPWEEFLADIARSIFRDATDATPTTAERRVIAIVSGRSMLEGSLRKVLPRVLGTWRNGGKQNIGEDHDHQ